MLIIYESYHPIALANILFWAKASQGAWLIVQHADHDVKFQKQCLKLMIEKLKTKKVEPLYIPYLTDRVLVNQGKPQFYGTQFHLNKLKRLIPRPIKTKSNLNKRRKEFGLESFTRYQQRLQQRQLIINNKKG